MKIIILFILGIVALPVKADYPNVYAEFLGGTSRHEAIFDDESIVDDKPIAYFRIVSNINSRLAMEIFYQDHGKGELTYVDEFSDTINAKFEVKAIHIGVKGIIPVRSAWSLVGRLGLGVSQAELQETDSSFADHVFRDKAKSVTSYYGFGVEYEINERFYLGVEYMASHVSLDSPELTNVNYKVESIAVSIGVDIF